MSQDWDQMRIFPAATQDKSPGCQREGGCQHTRPNSFHNQEAIGTCAPSAVSWAMSPLGSQPEHTRTNWSACSLSAAT